MRQPQRLPESLSTNDVDAFLATLATHRDRAMVLVMLLGGLRSAEARGLLLADVDMGRRRLRVIGKGGKERHVPVDAAFFTELAAYLRWERPPGLATPQCFVVLRGRRPVHRSARPGCAACSVGTGRPLAPQESAAPFTAYLRHRIVGGRNRSAGVAGVDGACLAGDHGRYVHLSIEQLAAEYGAARATLAEPGSDHGVGRPTRRRRRGGGGLSRPRRHPGFERRAVRDRIRIARDFTARHRDLHAWMTLPAAERIAEIRDTGRGR
ncbi:phage integrase family protein [Mycobacterium sp. MAC_080597_8934]|nr:phage integrase family protein [Mycobacterium sp. MAC_080597_8934]